MVLKILNKKEWHIGSLRNIENVQKGEQKLEEYGLVPYVLLFSILIFLFFFLLLI